MADRKLVLHSELIFFSVTKKENKSQPFERQLENGISDLSASNIRPDAMLVNPTAMAPTVVRGAERTTSVDDVANNRCCSRNLFGGRVSS